MKFLIPSGGVVDHDFGIITNYNHKNTPLGVREGMAWGGDVPVYSKKGFEPDKWTPWINTMRSYIDTCLFMTCPDVLGDAKGTIKSYKEWRSRLDGFPVAFVGQDGQESLEFPPLETWQTLFIGGSTKWKESQSAIDCIKFALSQGKRIHIGRVNWRRRYKIFDLIEGSENFTCDGTRTRFDGVKKTMVAWRAYQNQKPFIYF